MQPDIVTSTSPVSTVTDTRALIARQRLEAAIEKGRTTASNVVNRVLNNVPTDALVPGSAVEWAWEESANKRSDIAGSLVMEYGGKMRRIHSNAFAQIAERASVPRDYLQKLVSEPEDWKHQLAVDIITTHYRDGLGKTRFLSRSVDNDCEVRGWLSDRFRRLDARPLLDTFVDEASKVGAVPYDGTASDTRCALKVILPRVVEVTRGEHMVLGVEQANSDFGNGTYTLRMFALRLVCLNGLVGESALREVHLGGRLPDTIEFSRVTYEHDTRTMISATRDTVRALLNERASQGLLGAIGRAATEELSWAQASRKLGNNLTKAELAKVKEQYESNEVVMLPEQKTAWRLSNALSFLAQNMEPERKLDFERMAGKVIAVLSHHHPPYTAPMPQSSGL